MWYLTPFTDTLNIYLEGHCVPSTGLIAGWWLWPEKRLNSWIWLLLQWVPCPSYSPLDSRHLLKKGPKTMPLAEETWVYNQSGKIRGSKGKTWGKAKRWDLGLPWSSSSPTQFYMNSTYYHMSKETLALI